MYLLITLFCLFNGMKTLSALVCFEHSSLNTVLTTAVVPLARPNLLRLLYLLFYTLSYASVTKLQHC